MNDAELRERLLAAVPDHRTGFWSDLSHTLTTTVTATPSHPHPQGAPVSAQLDRPTDLDAYRSSSAIRGRRSRWLVAAGWAAAAAVVIGAGTTALRLNSAPQEQTPAVTASTAPSAASSTSPSAAPSVASATAPSTSPAVVPHVLGEVPAADALAQLRRADVTPIGDVVKGTQWTDLNGDNLLVLERDWKRVVGSQNASGMQGTLTMVHLAHVETGRPTVLRTLTQPSLPGGGPKRSCDTDPMLDYVKDSVQVTDVDGDGYSEASVAWYMLCGGGNPGLNVRLAYVTNGKYYIARGVALVYSLPYQQGLANALTPSYTFDPAISTWPSNLADQATGDIARYFN